MCRGSEISAVCLHRLQSQDIHVHHMKIRSRMYAPNSDGVDPDSCRNVMIEHNDISTGEQYSYLGHFSLQ